MQAEKQLLAYVFFRHTLLRQERSGSLDDEELAKRMAPKVHLGGGITIYVSDERPPCADCLRCVDAFEERTGIKVGLYHKGLRKTGSRRTVRPPGEYVGPFLEDLEE